MKIYNAFCWYCGGRMSYDDPLSLVVCSSCGHEYTLDSELRMYDKHPYPECPNCQTNASVVGGVCIWCGWNEESKIRGQS